MKPVMALAVPRDRATLVRQLQSALNHAGCYRGDISGVWTDASREAMQKFVTVVNAQLPVSEPDTTLLALVGSNADVSCASGAVLTTGALSAPPPAAPRPAVVAEAAAPSHGLSITDRAEAAEARTSMLDNTWVPTGMLDGARLGAPAEARNDVALPVVEALIVGSSEPDGGATVAMPAAKVPEAPPVADPAPRKITLAVEPDDRDEDEAKPATKTASKEVADDAGKSAKADDDEDDAKPARKSHSKKSKTPKAAKASRKRPAAAYAKQEGSQSLSKSFDQLARSVSGFFN